MKEKKTSPLDAQSVLRELAVLRARVDQAAEQYSLAMKAGIDEIAHQLRPAGTREAGRMLPEPRSLEKLGMKMKRLTQKPLKGRARELKRIQDLVDALSAAMQAGI